MRFKTSHKYPKLPTPSRVRAVQKVREEGVEVKKRDLDLHKAFEGYRLLLRAILSGEYDPDMEQLDRSGGNYARQKRNRERIFGTGATQNA